MNDWKTPRKMAIAPTPMSPPRMAMVRVEHEGDHDRDDASDDESIADTEWLAGQDHDR